jgi:hypothetical protein
MGEEQFLGRQAETQASRVRDFKAVVEHGQRDRTTGYPHALA